MSKLSQSLESFSENYSSTLGAKKSQLISQIEQNSILLQGTAFKVEPSVAEFERIFVSENSTTFPPAIRIGLQELAVFGEKRVELQVPLLLPVASQNAVLFDVEDALGEDVSRLFQNIALRIMLELNPGLCKFHYVDANFGSSFGGLSCIKNKNISSSSYNSITQTNSLITEISQVVVNANQTYLSQYQNLSDYNTHESKLAKPYHIVLINDFPACFSTNALSDLRKFINRGNASRAGVFFFINYCKQRAEENGVSDLRDFNIDDFKKISTCIEVDQRNKIVIKGTHLPRLIANADIRLDTETPRGDVMGGLTDMIEHKEPPRADISLNSWIEGLKENDGIWKGNTSEGIDIPVGFSISDPGKYFNFYIANEKDSRCGDYFSLVAGNPGFGKTTLLKTIIVNACMKYSPEELELYLVDFANGASFSVFKNLPHAKVLMLANNREYALRILTAMEQEAERRAELYTSVLEEYGKNIEKFSEYRDFTGKKLPRILIVMDEFHYLFTSSNPSVFEAREKLINGIRQWRKFGINIILSTQSISGVNFGDANDYITYRFAFNLIGVNSMSVLRNKEAERLTDKGQCLMNNTSDGDVSKNIEFRCAITEKIEEHIRYLTEKYQITYDSQTPIRFVCTAIPHADLMSNTVFSGKQLSDDEYRCYTYLGKPDLLRIEHTRLCYQRRDGSNTVMLGTDYPTAINTIVLSLFQARKQLPQGSIFYVVDCTNPGDEYQHSFDELPHRCNDIKLSNVNIITDINSLLVGRKEDMVKGIFHPERIFVVFFNIHNTQLLKVDTSQGYPKPSQLMSQLLPIIKEGPSVGIHSIVHSGNARSLFSREGIFGGDGILSHFDNKILLKGTDVEAVSLNESTKITPVDTAGTMVVFNHRLDGERYEQCKYYATLNREKLTIEKINHFFNS